MTAPRDLTPVNNTAGTRVAGKHGKTDEIAFFLQFRTLLGVFLNDSALLLVALNPGFLGHKGEKD